MNGSLQRYASGYFMCTRLQGLCVARAPKKSTAGGEPIKRQLGQTGDKPASKGEVAGTCVCVFFLGPCKDAQYLLALVIKETTQNI